MSSDLCEVDSDPMGCSILLSMNAYGTLTISVMAPEGSAPTDIEHYILHPNKEDVAKARVIADAIKGWADHVEKPEARMEADGVRDPQNPCEYFVMGDRKARSSCDGDGHYLCKKCMNWNGRCLDCGEIDAEDGGCNWCSPCYVKDT